MTLNCQRSPTKQSTSTDAGMIVYCIHKQSHDSCNEKVGIKHYVSADSYSSCSRRILGILC